jgi:hypothetical protein
MFFAVYKPSLWLGDHHRHKPDLEAVLPKQGQGAVPVVRHFKRPQVLPLQVVKQAIWVSLIVEGNKGHGHLTELVVIEAE